MSLHTHFSKQWPFPIRLLYHELVCVPQSLHDLHGALNVISKHCIG